MKSAHAARLSRSSRHILEQVCAVVRGERRRQIYDKGHSTEDDDDYNGGELVLAAAGYLIPALPQPVANRCRQWPWPWPERPLKAKTHTRDNLIIAAALLHAEIERLDRAEQEVEPRLPLGKPVLEEENRPEE